MRIEDLIVDENASVLDALNGIAWDDDSQVTELLVRKYPRGRDPERIVVSVSRL